jgi:predicted negative regulator of RcsB-dependent stress response
MAEYSSDEERFSAFVNFFKDNKNTLLIGFFFLASILFSSIGYKSYNTSQNLAAAQYMMRGLQISLLSQQAHQMTKKILISFKKNIQALDMLSLQE